MPPSSSSPRFWSGVCVGLLLWPATAVLAWATARLSKPAPLPGTRAHDQSVRARRSKGPFESGAVALGVGGMSAPDIGRVISFPSAYGSSTGSPGATRVRTSPTPGPGGSSSSSATPATSGPRSRTSASPTSSGVREAGSPGASKPRGCPKRPGSSACLTQTWPSGHPNLCWSCEWWDQFAPEEPLDQEG